VTVGRLNQAQVYRTDDFSLVATIPVGKLPHGVRPAGDGSRICAGLENADALAAIDTATNAVIGTVPVGQAAQAIDLELVDRADGGGAGESLAQFMTNHADVAGIRGSAAKNTVRDLWRAKASPQPRHHS
jgi:YVTN family beta-propeller protein